MNDLYLKFPDEATAQAALYDGETPLYRNIDAIGIIYERTGGTDEEPVMTPIPGWHVNVRLADEDGAALEPYAVTVATPVRVWA